jgi:glycosyltransferase involved in cell wall biosynthesis
MWSNPRGDGRFTRNAIGRLVDLDADTTYILYTDRETMESGQSPPRAEFRSLGRRNARDDVLDRGRTRSPGDLFRMTSTIRGERLDAFLFPSLISYFPVFGIPTVVGVHDTTAVDFPDLVFSSRRAAVTSRIKARWALAHAAVLFTVSASSKSAIADRLGVDEQSLVVVPEAPDPVFFPRPADVRAQSLEEAGIPARTRYILYAGGINPHKNVISLVDAYALLRSRMADPPWLLIAGALERSYISAGAELTARIGALGLNDSVRLLGFVRDDTLACLYSGAAAVVVPSLAEGFSLPPVEAAACGAPVIASDLAVHREVLGSAALYFAPTDTRQLADALDAVLTDNGLRSAMRRKGSLLASRLSWDTAAEKLQVLIQQAVSR